MIGSFGASAVLIYGATNSPLAQPRNLVGGHIISALVGVTIHKLIPGELWLSSALAVSTSSEIKPRMPMFLGRKMCGQPLYASFPAEIEPHLEHACKLLFWAWAAG